VYDVRHGPPSVEDAIALAADAHRGQHCYTPEGEPFIFHPLRVMLSFPDDSIAQIVAVMHDVIEDTDVTLGDLAAAGYSAQVVAALDALTHREGEGESYEDYVDRVAANDIARRVKVADLRQNLANNRRNPSAPGNADRIERYERALVRLGVDESEFAVSPPS
jgi:hypothetical protein